MTLPTHIPPPPPRPVTAVVRRRSWLEPRVRFWWMAGLVLAAVVVYFAATRVLGWVQEVRLVNRGTAVTATIERIGQGETEGRSNLSPDNIVMLSFDFGGQTHYVSGYLDGWHDLISLKQKLPIKVDAADPEKWTSRQDVPPFTHGLLGAGLVAPFAAAALAISLALRGRAVKTWKTGRAEPFVVVDAKQTALAPRSRAVRCTKPDGRDARLTSVYIPMKLADPKPGETLWLIHPPGKPTAALPAVVYE